MAYVDYPYYIESKKPSFWEALASTGARVAPALFLKYYWGNQANKDILGQQQTNDAATEELHGLATGALDREFNSNLINSYLQGGNVFPYKLPDDTPWFKGGY